MHDRDLNIHIFVDIQTDHFEDGLVGRNPVKCFNDRVHHDVPISSIKCEHGAPVHRRNLQVPGANTIPVPLRLLNSVTRTGLNYSTT